MNAPRLPAVFIGHGSPMNAIERTPYSEAWERLGRSLPRPKAILAISAHWYVEGTAVTAQERPPTIHDFHGFPPELYRMRYPAPGDPRLAARIREVLAPVSVRLDDSWGYDHGTWSVLVHSHPAADVPVLQLGIDATRPPAHHYELGRRLAALRDEGVLIAGFGNVVHNLRAMRQPDSPPYDWAVRFNDAVRERILSGDHAGLVDYAKLGEPARLSVPTPEHYLPLLYVCGSQMAGEASEIAIDGIDMSSVSMLSAVLGGRA